MSVRRPQKDVNANQAFVHVLTFSYEYTWKSFYTYFEELNISNENKVYPYDPRTSR